MSWFDDDTASSEGEAPQVVRADPRAVAQGWDTATDWAFGEAAGAEAAATQGAEALAAEATDLNDDAAAVIDDAADEFEDQATQFANNAQTQFEKDPIDFVNTALGGTHVDYDEDASDGTLGFHMRNVYGKVDATWQDGQGSHVTSQAGADWGRAPYLATELQTDDNGEITKLTGTGKLTIPLEAADIKAEATGGYQKTSDGYTATFSESGGASVDGVEVMGGLHGGVQDHGEHGMTVTGGDHVSIGKGEGGHESGFDPLEGALKVSNDLTYGEVDGQRTYGASTTAGGEVKVIGQTVASGQNTVGAQYTEGPQGDQISVYDTASGTIGNQKFGGSETGSEGAKYTYGTDAQGNEVSQVTATTQVSQTDANGNQTQSVNDTNTYDAPLPDVDVDAAPASTPAEHANDSAAFDEQPMILTAPDLDAEQPMILTNPEAASYTDLGEMDSEPVTLPFLDAELPPVTDSAVIEPEVIPDNWSGSTSSSDANIESGFDFGSADVTDQPAEDVIAVGLPEDAANPVSDPAPQFESDDIG